MNDLISRQAAIEATIKRDADCGIDSAEVLRSLPSAEPERKTGEWISTSERMPEESGDYLVWMPYAPPGHRIAIATYYSDHGGYWGIKTPISAWMSLPEPYQPKEDKQ